MSKKKQARYLITLECIKCRKNLNQQRAGVSRYITSKNRVNNPNKLEINKYCKYCNSRVIHEEIK